MNNKEIDKKRVIKILDLQIMVQNIFFEIAKTEAETEGEKELFLRAIKRLNVIACDLEAFAEEIRKGDA